MPVASVFVARVFRGLDLGALSLSGSTSAFGGGGSGFRV